MRILYVADSSSWHNAKWTEYFAGRHSVALFSDYKPEYPKVEFHPDVERIELPTLFQTGNRHLNKILSGPHYVRRLRRLLAERGFDIVHCVALYYANLAIRTRTDLPIVYTPQGSELLVRARSNLVYRAMARSVFARVDVVTGDSEVIQSAGFELGARPTENYIIQNGVDRLQFRPDGRSRRAELGVADGEILVFSPRALDPLYEICDIVDAYAQLVARGLPVRCMFAYPFGNEYGQALRDRVRGLGLDERTIWLKYVPHAEMPEYFRAADVVVSVPSSDSSPKTVYEAMACGTPTVVSALPWTHLHLVDGIHTLTVPVNAPAEIADRIARLVGNAVLRESIGRAASDLVGKVFDYHDNMRRMEQIMERAVERSRKRAAQQGSAARLRSVDRP